MASITLGLILLTLPTTLVWEFSSAFHTKGDLVGITRTVSPQNGIVTLTMTYEVHSTFNPFPVAVSDMSFNLVARNETTLSRATCNGGTFYPYGHLPCVLVFIIIPPDANNFRESVIVFDLHGGQDTTVSSLIYTGPLMNFGSFPTCWNITSNTAMSSSIGPGPYFRYVCT